MVIVALAGVLTVVVLYSENCDYRTIYCFKAQYDLDRASLMASTVCYSSILPNGPFLLHDCLLCYILHLGRLILQSVEWQANGKSES